MKKQTQRPCVTCPWSWGQEVVEAGLDVVVWSQIQCLVLYTGGGQTTAHGPSLDGCPFFYGLQAHRFLFFTFFGIVFTS